MARKKPLHQKRVPHFISVTVIVTGLVLTLAGLGYIYRMGNPAVFSDVASATNMRVAKVACDIDNNKRINTTDRKIIQQCANKAKSCTAKLMERSDLTKDKRVTAADLNAFNKGCVPPKPTPKPSGTTSKPPTPTLAVPNPSKPVPTIITDSYCAFFPGNCEPCSTDPSGYCIKIPSPTPAKFTPPEPTWTYHNDPPCAFSTTNPCTYPTNTQ